MSFHEPKKGEFSSDQLTYVPLKRADYSNGFCFNNKFFDKMEKVERFQESPFAKKMSYISAVEKNKMLLRMSMCS